MVKIESLYGRKTYEIFEAYWPYQPEDDPIARMLCGNC